MGKVSNDIAEDYKKRGQQVAVNADGGYLVPLSVASSILEKRRASANSDSSQPLSVV